MSWRLLDDIRHRLRTRRAAYVGLFEIAPSADDAARLVRIFEAMRRLDAGTYGACLRCDMPIEPPVLLDEPEATRCEVCELF